MTQTADARRLPSPNATCRHAAHMRQARFSATMRGFDKVRTHGVPQEAADGFRAALRENERLRQEIAAARRVDRQFRELRDQPQEHADDRAEGG